MRWLMGVGLAPVVCVVEIGFRVYLLEPVESVAPAIGPVALPVAPILMCFLLLWLVHGAPGSLRQREEQD